MKPKNLGKLPKRKITVDDIIGTDDIQEIIDDLSEQKYEIEELVLIYKIKEEKYARYSVNGLLDSRVIYLLEMVKSSVLKEI